jgi:hypothetical protein
MIMAGMNIFAAILVATFVRTGRTLPKPVPFCLSNPFSERTPFSQENISLQKIEQKQVFFNAIPAENSIKPHTATAHSLRSRSSPAISRFHGDIFTEFENSTDNLEMDQSSQVTPMEVTDDVKKKPPKRKATTDKDGFIQPARTTRRRKSAIAALRNSNIDTSNRFENLTDDETDTGGYDTETSSKTSSKPQKKIAKITTKPPKPIYVTSSCFLGVKNSLTTLALSKPPDFKIVGKQIKVMAHTKEDKKLVQEKLTQTSQQHYTFTEPEDRHLQFVLYGHHIIDAEVLKEELVAANIPASKVSKINRSTESPVFLVSFEKKSEVSLQKLQTIHGKLNCLVVRWAKFQPNQRRPTQCHRCQRFGHSANNCGLAFRCVKCLETHEPGQCARVTREGLPSCVNCGTEGHASNSTTCPAYKKHVDSIVAKKRKDTHARQPREFPATRYTWNQNFTPAVASQPPQSTSQSQPVSRNNREYRPSITSHVNRPVPDMSDPFSQLSEIQAELAAIPDIEQTIALFAKLVAELKSARNQNERVAALFKFCGPKPLQSASQP